jgi:hypothetical protein
MRVGIATGYGLVSRGSITDMGKRLFFAPQTLDQLKSTQPPIQWVLEHFSPGIKRPEHEADHSPPSRAEVKSWSYNSPSTCVFMA